MRLSATEVRAALGDVAGAHYIDIGRIDRAYEALKQNSTTAPEELSKMLGSLDTAGKGTINVESLKFMLQHYGEKFERVETEHFSQLLGTTKGVQELPVKQIVDMVLKIQKS